MAMEIHAGREVWENLINAIYDTKERVETFLFAYKCKRGVFGNALAD